MAAPTRTQLLSLDVIYKGQPFARVAAKSTLTGDYQLNAAPFTILGLAEGGPPPPFVSAPIYSSHRDTAPPSTATTLARETGDVLLTDDGFTVEEEDETPSTNPATMELFVGSTPTTGTWVVDTRFGVNDPSSGVLRSPLPSGTDADESAYLTLVTTAPNTRVSFRWGVRGLSWSWDLPGSDQFHFYVNDVEQVVAYPPVSGSAEAEAVGAYTFALPPGTHTLRWRWQRPDFRSSMLDSAHAWITDLLVDPNF